MDQNQESEKSQLVEIAKEKAKRVAVKKVKQLGRKAGKAAAKLAINATVAVTKAIVGVLASIGLPYILIAFGGVLLLFFVYLGITITLSNDESFQISEAQKADIIEVLELSDPDLKLLDIESAYQSVREFDGIPDDALKRFFIELLGDRTVDMNESDQIPFRVPDALIISALQIYDSTRHGKTDLEAAQVMAQALKPIFQYETLEGSVKTTTVTCLDGDCTTTTETKPYTVKLLVKVEAWNMTLTGIIEPLVTEGPPVSTTETVYEEKTNLFTGETTVAEVTKITTVQTTVKGFKYKQNREEDYSHFDRVLSSPPFDYGQKDRFMVEAIYQATGGVIRYTEWLNGDSFSDFSGSVTPGAGIPPEFMKFYLEAEKIYNVNWYYLASLHYTETAFSTHPTMISSSGAEGHTQFMPCTWLGWSYPSCKNSNGAPSIPDTIKYNPMQIKVYGGYGIDADNNGVASPWEIKDAIFTSASYLSKNGFSKNVDSAILAYNRADWYVAKVKATAEKFKREATYSPESGDIPNLQPGSFMRPATGPLSSGFGQRIIDGKKDMHYGVDIRSGGKTNIPIVASADGVVSRVVTGCPPQGHYGSTCGGGWGNHIFIQHTVGGKVYEAVYAHFNKVEVTLNQTVKQGQYLGIMGTSGSSTGIHLHFELYNGVRNRYTNVLNPTLYVPF